MKNQFTKEEISVAQKTRDIIISEGTTAEKAIYMAGEICMHEEIRQNQPVPAPPEEPKAEEEKEGKSAEEIKTPGQILREVCKYKDDDLMEESDDITVSEALEAIKKYHAQQFQSTPISKDLKEYMQEELKASIFDCNEGIRLRLKNGFWAEQKEKYERFLTELSTLNTL